jgi:hypothetical protein
MQCAAYLIDIKAEPADLPDLRSSTVMTGHTPSDIDLSVAVPALCGGTASERDIADFARLCVRLSIATLMFLQSKGYRIFDGTGGGPSFEDTAADAIADLFERDAEGAFVRFRRYFGPHLGKAESHAEWLVLLRRLVSRRVQQALSRVFRERDPEGARIRRGLKMAALKHGRWKLETAFGRQWIRLDHGIVRPPAGDAGRTLPEDDRLSALACGRFNSRDTLPVLLDKLSDFFMDHPELPARLELNDAVRLVRGYRKGAGRPAESQPSGAPLSPDLVQAVESGRDSLFRKIDKDYKAKGKLDDCSAAAFCKALSDIVDDILAGDPPGPYFEYLRVHLEGLDEERYRAELRTKFEYMAKLLKRKVERAVLIF